MEPIPETYEALEELSDEELQGQLLEAAGRVEEVVPDCVGMSVTMLRHGVTFTLVASDEAIAVIDAIQYLAGGPCLLAVDAEDTLETRPEDDRQMDERGWQLFAQASTARGIASTLSMPILDDGEVVGGVNLYGATRRAFEGHHEQLAEILGAWAAGAVTNADLDFTTRSAAERAPEVLRSGREVDAAIGALTQVLAIDMDEARQRFTQAADRARLTHTTLAIALTRLLDGE